MTALDQPPANRFSEMFSEYQFSTLSYARLIPQILSAYFFITEWAQHYGLKLSTKFRLKQSALTATILEDIYTPQIMQTYFASAALQRVWDDLYDQNTLTANELTELRAAVISGSPTQLEIAQKLRAAYVGIVQNVMTSTIPYQNELYNLFVNELNSLVDGYEIEAEIKLKKDDELTVEDETAYFNASTNSIALKYVCTVIAFSLVQSSSDLEEFTAISELSKLCSIAVRLANDVGGYEEDIKERKRSSVEIRRLVHQETVEQAKNYYLDMIYDNLVKIKQLLAAMPENIFAKMLTKITFLATQRYLDKTM